MEIWLVLIFSLCLCASLKLLVDLFSHNKSKHKKLSLPPGPPKVPIIGSFLWLQRSSFSQIEQILNNLRHKYGPIVTLHIGSRPSIFITNHSLAHQALIENGATFADRPPGMSPIRFIKSNLYTINSASYGPMWRLLRRNLTSEIFHPSRVKSFAQARNWVLETLTERLKHHVESGELVQVMDHFQYAMFCLLVFMCLGEKLDEKVIREIEETQRTILLNAGRFRVFALFGKLGKIVFRKRWHQLLEMRRRQESVFIPLIRARRERKEKKQENPNEFVVSYVDTLIDLQIPDEGGRNLSEEEMVTLCSEFLNAGTDTTSTALQWIMANLVKNQEIQERLYSEIQGFVSSGEKKIREEDLQKIPYLKAVVLEGLRRHPPGHFVLPHAVTEDIVLDGHVIPKKATVNFMVAEMGWDPKVWKDPMEFKPDRFLSKEGEEVFDITGSREIKMMPFGVGRRICPGLGLALHHLEYFVANLVRDFKWTAVDGDDIDLSEKQEFTVVMKNPLRANILPRVE
ncbi:cytochrome P450 89A2-like [Macadamia integrifolia]|uniref:cytochrome P450 89A2-like n=1 Tax=Macadamia integrifolia TaxID=60698 RepID=UPI001C4F2DB9|nr:cytochrome P450 89A2-like [Macadamia integrifolia]